MKRLNSLYLMVKSRLLAFIILYVFPLWKNESAVKFVDTFGSWRFISYQTLFMIVWILLNIVLTMSGMLPAFDPYPFVLLNLMLSFQTAIFTPIILLGQNHQSEGVNQSIQHDLECDLRTEHELKEIKAMLERLMKELGL